MGQMEVEDVQLTEYKDGRVIKFNQQNFHKLREELLKTEDYFIDEQFFIESSVNGQTIELKRPKDLINNPLLVLEKNTYFHMGQGLLGNCWFVSALMSLYEQKDLFHFIVPNDQSFKDKEYAGIFHFRFWQVGKWVDVVVDDRLPTLDNELIYLRSKYRNEFWPSLIEKAYAKLISRSYKAFFEGSRGAISMQDLFGGIPETYDVPTNKTNAIKENKLFNIITNAKKKNTIVIGSTYNENTTTKEILEEMKIKGVHQAHSYAITDSKIIKVNSVRPHYLIRIRNPHGTEAKETLIGNIKNDTSIKSSLPELKVDGESWILLEDFVKFFAHFEICNLTPNIINADVYNEDHTAKLAITTVEGRWMGGLSDEYVKVAEILDTNPQYRMTLKQHKKYSMLIGLSLKHRTDLKLVSESQVGIFILHLNDDMNLPKPLNSSCKKCMDEIMKKKRFRFNWGQVSYRLELPPGVYYIIPLISNTIKRATYFLQILSEEKDILEVYDRDINVPKMKNQFQKISKTVLSRKKNRKVYEKFQNKYTKRADFKALYSILKNPKVSTNRLCKRPIQLDGISLNLQKLFSSEEFGSRKRLSIETIEHIFSTSAVNKNNNKYT
ncbi:hypothetical protein HCN44_009657 [Aphidius gifuensis]|uniref:Calpain catalytic domain-containing protein n=1 Tax=Aphidius gifuensis TaxID=684658 RepID=A0A834Y6R2_APHGI|nr:hypothetical protein HCN44_009657 [Aphidius gifuensis]